MSLATVLLVLLIVMLVAGGGWTYGNRGVYGYGPFGTIIAVLLILALARYLGVL